MAVNLIQPPLHVRASELLVNLWRAREPAPSSPFLSGDESQLKLPEEEMPRANDPGRISAIDDATPRVNSASSVRGVVKIIRLRLFCHRPERVAIIPNVA